jgi:hypothetical protein
MRNRVLGFVLGLVMFGVGCGENERQMVTVRTGEPPALLAARDEDSGVWQTFDTTGKVEFELEVSGPYRVVVACEYSNTAFMITEHARAPSDQPVIENSCERVREFPFVVRGEMTHAGRVGLGPTGRGQSSAPWSFELPAQAGSFDFVALFGDVNTGFDQVAIRRDLVVDGDVELGAIDPAGEHAAAMIPTGLVLTNHTADEQLSTRVRMASGNTTTRITHFHFGDELADTVKLAPDSMLRATDHQHVLVEGFLPGIDEPSLDVSRTAGQTARAGEPISLALPEPLGPVTFEASGDRLTAAWTTLPAYDQLRLARFHFSNDLSEDVLFEALISRAFVDATGASSAALDFAAIPGFKPAWRHDPMHAYVRQLTAIRGNFLADVASSQVREQVPGPSGEAPLARTRNDHAGARLRSALEAKLTAPVRSSRRR